MPCEGTGTRGSARPPPTASRSTLQHARRDYVRDALRHAVHLLEDRDLAAAALLRSLLVEVVGAEALQNLHQEGVVALGIVLDLLRRRRCG